MIPPWHLELIILCSRPIPFLRDKQTRMSSPLETATRPQCSEVVVWALDYKVNERKIHAFYFCRRLRVPEEVLHPNGRDMPYVNNVTCPGDTFDRRMTWKHRIERIVAKALRMYARIYSLFKSGRLSTNIKLAVYKNRIDHWRSQCTGRIIMSHPSFIHTLYKALIRSVMTYACPFWEHEADGHLLKLQRLQNTVLRATENLDRCTPTSPRIARCFQNSLRLWRRTHAEVILNHLNLDVRGTRHVQAMHRKYKRFELGGGQVYDRSAD
jgi:hypothetical protein